MKLIGSLTEKYHRESLTKLQVYFETHSRFEALSAVLDRVSGGKGRYFLLNVIPEQYEELLEFVLDETYIVVIEVPDENSMRPQLCSVTFLDEYVRKVSRSDQIRIAVAMDMSGQCNSGT